MKVFNKSAQYLEKAKRGECPRCKGFGSYFSQDQGEPCYLCQGKGELWISKENSGWTRGIYQKLDKSQLW